jgi:hypothetical protein
VSKFQNFPKILEIFLSFRTPKRKFGRTSPVVGIFYGFFLKRVPIAGKRRLFTFLLQSASCRTTFLQNSTNSAHGDKLWSLPSMHKSFTSSQTAFSRPYEANFTCKSQKLFCQNVVCLRILHSASRQLMNRRPFCKIRRIPPMGTHFGVFLRCTSHSPQVRPHFPDRMKPISHVKVKKLFCQ